MSPAARVPLMDRLPPWLWLALTVACLMPVWLWSTARFRDGSDDPLGIVALITLVVLLARDREHFRERPGAGWLMVTTALAALAVLGGAVLPALVRGVLAVLAVCAALWAVRAPRQPMLALTGLGLLALPLLSSLQYFVGYPLRVVTAEASRWLLSGFVDVTREGSALAVAGRLVIVDAPCSGIQIAWVAYFTACAVAALWRVPDLHFLRRIPLVGATVLAGNIVRNTLLVLKEAQLVHWPDWTHEVIGLAATGLVCLLVQWQVTAGSRPSVIERESRYTDMLGYHRSPLGTWARLVAFTGLGVLLLWPWGATRAGRREFAAIRHRVADTTRWPTLAALGSIGCRAAFRRPISRSHRALHGRGEHGRAAPRDDADTDAPPGGRLLSRARLSGAVTRARAGGEPAQRRGAEAAALHDGGEEGATDPRLRKHRRRAGTNLH